MLDVSNVENPQRPDGKGTGAKSQNQGKQAGRALPWEKDQQSTWSELQRCPVVWLEGDSWSTPTRFVAFGPQCLDQHV